MIFGISIRDLIVIFKRTACYDTPWSPYTGYRRCYAAFVTGRNTNRLPYLIEFYFEEWKMFQHNFTAYACWHLTVILKNNCLTNDNCNISERELFLHNENIQVWMHKFQSLGIITRIWILKRNISRLGVYKTFPNKVHGQKNSKVSWLFKTIL